MVIDEVKKNLGKMVGYKGNTDTYKLTACILRKNDSGFFYQAEIFDTKCGNSVTICKLSDIEVLA